MCVAYVAIQGSLCAKQIQGIVLAWIPKNLASIHLKGDAKNGTVLVLLLNSGANLISQGQRICANNKVAVFLITSESRNRKTTIDDSKRGSILEEARVAVLYANESWRENREAGISARHNSFFLS